MEKRKFQRVTVGGLQADISDGMGFFSGEIGDISRDGILVKDLPKRLNEQVVKMTIVVSGNGCSFKMLIRPRWAELDGLRKSVGFKIINTPWGWSEFAKGCEPKVAVDAWDEGYNA